MLGCCESYVGKHMFVAGIFAGFYHVLLKVRLFFGILDVCWIFERSAFSTCYLLGALCLHILLDAPRK